MRGVSKKPLLADVIAMMFHIDEKMAEMICDSHLLLIVPHAACNGCCTLNKYYSKTDKNYMNCIAMILTLKHKTTYFKQHGWKVEWIEEVERVIREVWLKKYKGHSK